MSSETRFPVPSSVAESTHIDSDRYHQMYKQSIESPDTFWAEQAEQFLSWRKPWHTVCSYDFSSGDAAWFEGADGKATMPAT